MRKKIMLFLLLSLLAVPARAAVDPDYTGEIDVVTGEALEGEGAQATRVRVNDTTLYDRARGQFVYPASGGEVYANAADGMLVNGPVSIESGVALTLTRNGWGYTELFVASDGDFLEIPKAHIDTSDFIGNTCRYRFRIDPKKLHAGNNFGSVTFSNAYFHLRIPVTVRMISTPAGRENYLQKKRLTLELIRLYSMFRLRRIPSQRWLQDAGDLTARMRALDPQDPAIALYQAHYMITAGRTEEGARILSEEAPAIMRMDPTDAVRCYYLYLTTLLDASDEEIMQVQRQIHSA